MVSRFCWYLGNICSPLLKGVRSTPLCYILKANGLYPQQPTIGVNSNPSHTLETIRVLNTPYQPTVLMCNPQVVREFHLELAFLRAPFELHSILQLHLTRIEDSKRRSLRAFVNPNRVEVALLYQRYQHANTPIARQSCSMTDETLTG